MPRQITKPIICVCGSRSIDYVNIDNFIDKDKVSEIITGGATGVDTLAEQWAKKNHIEFAAYLPNYKIYGKKAPLIRDMDMVDAADIVVAFWDNHSKGTKFTIDYAKKRGIYCIVHTFLTLD